jgi:hypothetical protein
VAEPGWERIAEAVLDWLRGLSETGSGDATARPPSSADAGHPDSMNAAGDTPQSR